MAGYPMQSLSFLKGALLIICGSVLWSLAGVGVKYCGFNAWQLAGMRGGIAAVTVLLLMPQSRRHWSWLVVLVGMGHVVTMFGFVLSTKLTTAANAIFLQCSYPLWVMIFSPLLLKESIRLGDVVSLVVFGVGMGMVFFAPEKATELSPDILAGNILALLSGVGFGLAVIGMRALRKGGAQASIVFGNAVVCVVGLSVAACLHFSGGQQMSWGMPRDWLVVLFLGSVQIGMGYTTYAAGLKYVRAMQASLIGLIEPVLNPVWVFLVFRQERPGSLATLGGAIILVATAFQVVAGARTRREPKESGQAD